MPEKRSESEWRDKRFARYGELIASELIDRMRSGRPFSVRFVADNFQSIAHLESDRNRYDVAVAICRELEERGKLSRQGRLYFVPRQRRKRKVRRSQTYS
jgi:hypothetical protein